MPAKIISNKATLFSPFLQHEIEINDECGCTKGGFYEKEITQHGFHGAIAWIKVAAFCDQCHRQLSEWYHKINVR